MSADGNCLFRSLSDQLYYDYGNRHDEVRSEVCDYLEVHEDEFSIFLVLDEEAGRVKLSHLVRLAQMGVTYVMLEGGSHLMGAALDADIVHKVLFIIAPKIIGGAGSPVAIAGMGAERMEAAAPSPPGFFGDEEPGSSDEGPSGEDILAMLPARVTATKAAIILVVTAALPFLAYMSFLASYLSIDVLRAILAMPGKLEGT